MKTTNDIIPLSFSDACEYLRSVIWFTMADDPSETTGERVALPVRSYPTVDPSLLISHDQPGVGSQEYKVEALEAYVHVDSDTPSGEGIYHLARAIGVGVRRCVRGGVQPVGIYQEEFYNGVILEPVIARKIIEIQGLHYRVVLYPEHDESKKSIRRLEVSFLIGVPVTE